MSTTQNSSMLRIVAVAGLVAFLLSSGMGKIYDRCSLVRTLDEIGTPRDKLAIWACIAEHETGYDTEAVGPKDKKGVQSFGMFPVNNHDWCEEEHSTVLSYNFCRVDCEDFLVDDVVPNFKCADIVYNTTGFRAWKSWKVCNGTLPDVDDCF